MIKLPSVSLTAACCPRKDFYTHTPNPHLHPPKKWQQTLVLGTKKRAQKIHTHSIHGHGPDHASVTPLLSVQKGNKKIATQHPLTSTLKSYPPALIRSQALTQIIILYQLFGQFLNCLHTFSTIYIFYVISL